MLRINWIHGSRIPLTGKYHAIRNATGTAVTNPSAKPARIEIIELQKSCASAPLSTIFLAASRIAGINGKLRAVFGLIDNANHNRTATAREISTHVHPGIDCSAPFFFLSIVTLLSMEHIHFYFVFKGNP